MNGRINVPNALTASRILVSLILLIVRIQNFPFLLLYLYAGLSDLADGYLARKQNCSTDFGAKLDTVADLFMFGIVIQRCYNDLLDYQMVLYWSLIVLFVKACAVILMKIRFGIFGIVHTYGNKILGIFLFALPFFSREARRPVLYGLCLFATVVVLEEIVITATSREINLNRKSFFG